MFTKVMRWLHVYVVSIHTNSRPFNTICSSSIYGKWRLWNNISKPIDNCRGINENLVKWCSCALLTQRICFYKIIIWCFLRLINVITAYVMTFTDFYVVVVCNIIEKWVIYCYLLHIENCIFFSDIFCNISIKSAHISMCYAYSTIQVVASR